MRITMMVLGGWTVASVVLSLLVGRVLARLSTECGDVPTAGFPANVIPITADRRAAPSTAAPAR